MTPPETVTVLNTPCVLTDIRTLTGDLAALCAENREGTARSIDFTNVHIVAMRAVDSQFYQITQNVDWFVSDSQVLTWGITAVGGKNHERAYGPEFLDYFIRNGDASLTHYFLGGSQECLDRLLENVRALRPELKIVGSRNGYFKSSEDEEIRAGINAVRPDLVWVGLGTPKQQEWISANKDRIHAGALLAVGFAFDVNAGTKDDAPRWLGPLGLTWLYRLVKEPRRLWKRYLYYNSVFLAKLALQLATGQPSSAPRSR